jgi:hypothetical protein
MRTARQLAMIAEVVGIAGAAGVMIWLRGGWALDFYLGNVTRDHTDIDFFTWATTADVLVAGLADHGYHSLTGPPPDQPWAGEPFPQAAPHNEPGRIGTVECAVVNPHGQVEIKQMTPEWSPHLRRRPKDATDIARLKAALHVGAPAAG